MEALLSTTESYSPLAWLHLVHQNDPDERCIVTELSHYKQESSWPALQPEYLILRVQSPPDLPQPALAPVLVSVSRDVCGRGHPSRYRLWGTTDDRVTVLGPADDIQIHDQQLHHLTWEPPDEAPRLEEISCFVACSHYDIPQHCLFLSKCCYALVHAILQAVHNTFSGIPGTLKTQFLIPDAYLVHTIRPGMPEYRRVSISAITHYRIFRKEEGGLDEKLQELQRNYLHGPSFFSFIFPIRFTSVRFKAEVLAKNYKRRLAIGRCGSYLLSFSKLLFTSVCSATCVVSKGKHLSRPRKGSEPGLTSED
ncbi:hypothetical protein V8E55_011651 [Tylopilus felleus]